MYLCICTLAIQGDSLNIFNTIIVLLFINEFRFRFFKYLITPYFDIFGLIFRSRNAQR